MDLTLPLVSASQREARSKSEANRGDLLPPRTGIRSAGPTSLPQAKRLFPTRPRRNPCAPCSL